MFIGLKLRKILEEKKLTQKALADLIGSNTTSVQNWCQDDVEIKLNNLHKICKALNVPITYFEEGETMSIVEESESPYRKKCEMCEVKDKLIAALELNNQMLLNELRKYDPGFEAKEAS